MLNKKVRAVAVFAAFLPCAWTGVAALRIRASRGLPEEGGGAELDEGGGPEEGGVNVNLTLTLLFLSSEKVSIPVAAPSSEDYVLSTRDLRKMVLEKQELWQEEWNYKVSFVEVGASEPLQPPMTAASLRERIVSLRESSREICFTPVCMTKLDSLKGTLPQHVELLQSLGNRGPEEVWRGYDDAPAELKSEQDFRTLALARCPAGEVWRVYAHAPAELKREHEFWTLALARCPVGEVGHVCFHAPAELKREHEFWRLALARCSALARENESAATLARLFKDSTPWV